MQSPISRRRFLELSSAVMGVAVAGPATASPKQTVRSKKKGFCCGTKDAKDWQRLKSLNARWFYNWGAGIPEGRPKEIEFVPMIWGGGKQIQPTCRKLKAQGYKTVLGFNEPDQHDQSNMTVERALDLWPVLMESGMRLGSPGCVHPDREWMKAFMAQAKARKYRVDFVTMHWYWEPNPGDFLGRVEKVFKLYGLPIWLTEFAVADWSAAEKKPNRFSPDQVIRFMENALPRLEKAGFVERFCWFSAKEDDAHLGTSALFHKDGSLTKVGKVYASM